MERRAFLGGLGAAGGLAFVPRLAGAASPPRSRGLDRLRDAGIDIRARVEAITTKSATSSETVELALKSPHQSRVVSGGGKLSITLAPVAGRPDAVDVLATTRIESSLVTKYFVAFDFRSWSRSNYVVLPGACYAGNRFPSRRAAAYPPLLTERADIGPHVPPIIPAIPHLSAGDGPSSLAIDATDLATPAIGIFMPASRLGVIVLTDLLSADNPTTFRIEEKNDRTGASVIIGSGSTADAPGLRRPPERRSAAARKGAGEQIAPRVHLFDCPDVPALFEALFALRKEMTGKTALVDELPFSAAFARHEQRANARWVEKTGFLAVGARDCPYTTWQTGWCGGLMSTLPLLAAGGKESRERAAATIAFALDGGQAPSGFFHGVSDGKTWSDDGFAAPLPPPTIVAGGPPAAPSPVYKNARRWHLVRRTAEALTFLVKQLALLERRPELRPAAGTGKWAEACRASADALAKLWGRHKQLGQFVDIDSGELIVGGSTSAGLAPAGLALAAAQLKEPRFLEVAKAIGEHYHERFVRAGLTCGGPGDGLQAPDSQSAAALLDSFMTLFEATRDRIWIDRAQATAHLLASWVVAYDVPLASTACPHAGPRATGAVLWSAASRRGSPGYLVSSGDALLRLYRATGDVTLLELLRDTVHNLAQYLPAAGDPTARAAGNAEADCPRTESGEWLDAGGGVVPVDGAFDAIGLLSYTEVPGIYVRPDTGLVFVFDHVTARIKERARGRVVLAVANPTSAEATVRILSETAEAAAEPLHPGAVLDAQKVVVPAGGSVQVAVPPL
ncbi:MAG TPA: hypothetical protein VKQ32_27980 [Polyangia bacterium]|nr:hypothetical protein [Polyangia bacterium]